jgi:hypothetical protein
MRGEIGKPIEEQQINAVIDPGVDDSDQSEGNDLS